MGWEASRLDDRTVCGFAYRLDFGGCRNRPIRRCAISPYFGFATVVYPPLNADDRRQPRPIYSLYPIKVVVSLSGDRE